MIILYLEDVLLKTTKYPIPPPDQLNAALQQQPQQQTWSFQPLPPLQGNAQQQQQLNPSIHGAANTPTTAPTSTTDDILLGLSTSSSSPSPTTTEEREMENEGEAEQQSIAVPPLPNLTANDLVLSSPKQDAKILLAVSLNEPEHVGIVHLTLSNRSDIAVLLYSRDMAFVTKHPDDFRPELNWMTIYQEMLQISNTTKDDNDGFDWFIRCPSNAYLRIDRLQPFLHTLRHNNTPIFMGWKNPHAEDEPYFHAMRRCILWNRATANLIGPAMSKCSLSDYGISRHDHAFGECLDQQYQVPLTFLPQVRQYNSPCDILNTHEQWMYPHLFRETFRRSTLTQWLALENPHVFQSPTNCTCTMSKIAYAVQQCGAQRVFGFLKSSDGRSKKRVPCSPATPTCSVDVIKDEQKIPLLAKTNDIPAYSISLEPNSTQQRVDRFLPSSVFRGQAMEGIRVPGNGIEGYRRSMAKALRMGLEQTNSSVICVLDDDFRVYKQFEDRWRRLIKSNACYHNTLLLGGALLLGVTIWDSGYWRKVEKKRHKYIHDDLCIDAHQFLRGSFAVIYSRKAAEMALEWIRYTPSDRPFDWFWMDYVDLGHPVRGVVDPLLVADVEHTSLVDPNRAPQSKRWQKARQQRIRRVDPNYRHQLHRWGNVDDYVPPSGSFL